MAESARRRERDRSTASEHRQLPVELPAEGVTDAEKYLGRLEGVTLAAREVAHLLNNVLTAALWTLQTLSKQPHLAPEVRRGIDRVLRCLHQAADHVQRLQQVGRVETKPTPCGPSLDLGRSTDEWR